MGAVRHGSTIEAKNASPQADGKKPELLLTHINVRVSLYPKSVQDPVLHHLATKFLSVHVFRFIPVPRPLQPLLCGEELVDSFSDILGHFAILQIRPMIGKALADHTRQSNVSPHGVANVQRRTVAGALIVAEIERMDRAKPQHLDPCHRD